MAYLARSGRRERSDTTGGGAEAPFLPVPPFKKRGEEEPQRGAVPPRAPPPTPPERGAERGRTGGTAGISATRLWA